jgi:hypothetical protein
MKSPERFPVLKTPRAKTGLLAAAFLALAVVACSGGNTAQSLDSTASSTVAIASSNPASAPIPAAITAVGTYGEDLYDQAKLDDWVKATAYLDSLHTAASKLPSETASQSRRPALDSAIAALDAAVPARNGAAALGAANRVTYVAAQMSRAYPTVTPTEVVLLDYYGRELDIWSARKNLPKLRETFAALESTWNAVRPAVVSNGGAGAAAQTDALVARIKAAKSPADYARIATPFLDQVDKLEMVFVKA